MIQNAKSNFHLRNIWIGLSSLILINVLKETCTLIVLHIDTIYLQWLVVHLGLLLSLGQKLCCTPVLYLFVQFLLYLFFLSLPCDPLVFQSLCLVVHLFLWLELLLAVLLHLLLTVPQCQWHLFLHDDSLRLTLFTAVFGWFRHKTEIWKRVQKII